MISAAMVSARPNTADRHMPAPKAMPRQAEIQTEARLRRKALA